VKRPVQRMDSGLDSSHRSGIAFLNKFCLTA